MNPSQVKYDILSCRPVRGLLMSPAVADPKGLETFRAITDEALAPPAGLLGLSIVGWIMLLATILAASRALAWVRGALDDSRAAARSALLAASILFMPVLAVWAWGT